MNSMQRRQESRPDAGPFALDVRLEAPFLQQLWDFARPGLESVSGLAAIGRAYKRVENAPDVDRFLVGALAELGIGWTSNEVDRARIPRTGGCVVVANHPYGAVEGMLLAALLRSVRPDVKILANDLLARLPPLRDVLLLVD